MAKRAGLAWDAVLSAEVFRHYKPDPQAYLACARCSTSRPGAMLMCAAHPDDLRAAAACGCRTAYIDRPLEFGPPGRSRHAPAAGAFDLHTTDMNDLAEQLGR